MIINEEKLFRIISDSGDEASKDEGNQKILNFFKSLGTDHNYEDPIQFTDTSNLIDTGNYWNEDHNYATCPFIQTNNVLH